MIEVIYEFVVKEQTRGQFELLYGPGGAWGRLFGQSPGFRGTTLLRDANNPLRYLVIDLWESEAQREQALSAQPAARACLETALAECCESRVELGTFRVRAEATVRPRRRSG